jgi:hypothetical protein
MKNQITISKLVVAITLFFTFFPNSNKTFAQQRGKEYFYVYVSGIFSENQTSYISQPIYFSSQENCGDIGLWDFRTKAQAAFGIYLQTNYPNAFPYNVKNVLVLPKQGYQIFRNMQQVNDALKDWKFDQNYDKYKTAETNFTYSCQ